MVSTITATQVYRAVSPVIRRHMTHLVFLQINKLC